MADKKTIVEILADLRAIRGRYRIPLGAIARAYPPHGCSTAHVCGILNGSKYFGNGGLAKVRHAFTVVLQEMDGAEPCSLGSVGDGG